MGECACAGHHAAAGRYALRRPIARCISAGNHCRIRLAAGDGGTAIAGLVDGASRAHRPRGRCANRPAAVDCTRRIVRQGTRECLTRAGPGGAGSARSRSPSISTKSIWSPSGVCARHARSAFKLPGRSLSGSGAGLAGSVRTRCAESPGSLSRPSSTMPRPACSAQMVPHQGASDCRRVLRVERHGCRDESQARRRRQRCVSSDLAPWTERPAVAKLGLDQSPHPTRS